MIGKNGILLLVTFIGGKGWNGGSYWLIEEDGILLSLTFKGMVWPSTRAAILQPEKGRRAEKKEVIGW